MEYIAIVLVIFVMFSAWRELIFARERKDLIDRLTKQQQDALDRIMAKDLREVKQEQAPPREPVSVTRRQNDKRLIEEARKIDGGV